MGKSVVSVLVIAIVGAALVAIPCTAANAASDGNASTHRAKNKDPKGVAVNNQKPVKSPWPPPMEDDFDRKNTSAGGM